MKKFLAHLFLRVMGWTPEGRHPGVAKCVVICAPHTSNWDFPLLLALGAHFDLKFSWMGKKELFRPPFGGLMRATGGIAIDRSRKTNLVEQICEHLKTVDELAIAIPVEATRSRAPFWKSGFYQIALAADIPVCFGYLDYKRKRGGLGPLARMTGDVKKDMDVIRAFYTAIAPKHPECYGPIRLREEDDPQGS